MKLFTPKDNQERISIEGDEFIAHMDGYVLKSVFQPIKHKETLITYGFEALVRVYKAGIAINPLDFLNAYKSETAITNVGILCYGLHIRNSRKVCLNGEKLFINAHPKMFSRIANDPYSIAETLKLSELCGVSKQQLTFEITEFKEGDFDLFKKGVDQFNSVGVAVAIDDFGSLDSNKSRVERIKPNIVKIDRELLKGFCENPEESSLIGVLNYLKNKNIIVIIEGIESDYEFNLVSHLPFDFVQGYLFGKPM